MPSKTLLLLTDPAHFGVTYKINPWMRPGAWAQDPVGHLAAARRSFQSLVSALAAAGARLEVMPGEAGLPDMVFPANAAVVLDRIALLARFRHPERQREERHFQTYFHALMERGLLDEVAQFPPGCFQEGAGDCIWDAVRGRFWAGYGQRSTRRAAFEISAFFGRETTALELVSPRFYHLDVCFCPLSGGEIFYYPPAFSGASLAAIRDIVAPEDLIEATDEDAAGFNVNAVNIGDCLVMAKASRNLVARLSERGYRVSEVDLLPFIMSGGGAYCMTLRLDTQSAEASAVRRAAE
ncbi:MAG TPA: arginine deiminase-related protein [Xanthobacteraceae bacterium]|nr:arginine deiminase-related protein [Xanthobacteraceae bacterium]